jgi:hypothetical protein
MSTATECHLVARPLFMDEEDLKGPRVLVTKELAVRKESSILRDLEGEEPLHKMKKL